MDLEVDLAFPTAFMIILWRQLKIIVPVKPWKTALASLVTYQTALFKNLTIPMTSTYNPNIIARSLAMTRYINYKGFPFLETSVIIHLIFCPILSKNRKIYYCAPFFEKPKPKQNQNFLSLDNLFSKKE